MKATIRDVAERAGVSITTVSYVINNTRFVSDDLRKRIEEAIKALNYQPNPLGRGLRKGKTYTVAMLSPDPGSRFFQRVYRGIEEHVHRHGFSVTCWNTDEDPVQEKSCISLVLQRAIDGLIIAPTMQSEDNIRRIMEEDLPVVVIDRFTENLSIDQVFSDNEKGATLATRHLLKLGHRRIAMITGLRGVTTTEQRLNGYLQCLRESGIEVDERLIVEGRSKLEEGYSAAARILAEEGVTALLSGNTMMMLGALKYLKEKEIKCPEEISLVGFDDPEWAAVFTPPLTVVAQQPYEMGNQAGELLFKQISDGRKRTQANRVQLPTRLIERDSTTICHRG